jgi:hypothetical protein
MKVKLTILASVVLLIATACVSSQIAADPNVSVYTEIPLAPNVVLTVENPVIAVPGSGYIWIDGYWTWDYRYREYVWVQGYWALVPYAGAFWIPGYWEYYRGGYRWIDARWLPKDYRFAYGYHNGRYDYYGRPVFYDQPHNVRTGHAYAYDNRSEYRGKGYSSSSCFNNTPKNERTRITREYQKETRNSTRPAGTDRNKQETIRIRGNNSQGDRESSTQRSSNTENSRTPATTSPGRTQPDNNRQNSGAVRSSESNSNVSRSSSEGSRTRESNSNGSNSSRSSSSNSRSSSSGSGRR